ncbi:ABC transporter ATP-binding protein [Corynebacterium sp. HS2168-gen11]|uniref:ABC transporter ATP-binding protein n=1 Tax=Corynebacterium sp. HS2168-gen11 TaxID=2974027 RepID=UPI00216B287C|nr:ABC transporter ATP-binding protein [Corynebacterium sp. HS2168-gen11]MCS4535098.1 ABC transporter ATP-binding protein/permease [Corynebacterium sp. HS2168-gen11]
MIEVDKLAPATLKESGKFLTTLPSTPRKRWYLGTFTLYALFISVMVGTSTLLGRVIDVVHDRTLFIAFLCLISLGFLLENVGRFTGEYVLLAKTSQMSIDLRKACLNAVLHAPIPTIMEVGTGNIITRLTKDIDRVTTAIANVGSRLTTTIFMMPFTIAALSLIHWSFGLLTFGIIILMTPVVRMIIRDFPTTQNRLSSTEAQRNNMLLDTIHGMSTIRALGLQRWALQRIEHKSWTTIIATAHQVDVFTYILATAQLIYVLLLTGVVSLAVYLAYISVLTAGTAAAAITLVVRLEMHIFNVLFFSGVIQQALTSLGRAVAVATMSANDHRPDGPDHIQPSVSIEHLSYAYPGGAPILQDLNLNLEAGTTTALVGASGAGKSTLANIIAGLQHPTAGTVRIGGIDTATVSENWTARHVALISQQVHLFSGTLRDDLRMAQEDASDEMILAVLAKVGLTGETFTRWFPQGLDTRIGAGAEPLSPEVEQQISLARIILRDPPILIMDEATSEAGSEHAKMLETAATAVAADRTTLVVAHRLDQAMLADRIILMDNGVIIEDGTHEQLLAAGGRYAQLFAHWEA